MMLDVDASELNVTSIGEGVVIEAVIEDYIDTVTSMIHIPQVPRPVSSVQLAKIKTPIRRQPCPPNDSFCVICQFPVGKRKGHWSTLPCGHTFHTRCLYGLSPCASMGAMSAMCCPLCRESIYRNDLSDMGISVMVRDLKRSDQHCGRIRNILSGRVHTEASLFQNLRGLRRLQSADGFIRSACTLHIERSIFHKLQLATQLHRLQKDQLSQESKKTTNVDLCDLYTMAIACHVEVLVAVRAIL